MTERALVRVVVHTGVQKWATNRAANLSKTSIQASLQGNLQQWCTNRPRPPIYNEVYKVVWEFVYKVVYKLVYKVVYRAF